MTTETGLYKLGSIIGLWRSQKVSYIPGITGPVITDVMYQQGLISQRLVSFYMTDSDHVSFLEFGNYDTALMSDPSLLQWIPILGDFPYWSLNVTGFRVGNNPTILSNGKQV